MAAPTPASTLARCLPAAALLRAGLPGLLGRRSLASSCSSGPCHPAPPPSAAALARPSPHPHPPPPPALSLAHPAFAVWGADTDVGKTLVSAGIASAAVRDRGLTVRYVKPVQTGWPADSDAAAVAGAAGLGLGAGPHAASLLPPGFAPSTSPSGSAATLFGWALPASPAAAAREEGAGPIPTEDEVAAAVAAALAGAPASCLALVESAGGPASPGPADVLQADGAWRGLRLPPLLVASPRLGGLSATLAAADFLALRGHGPPGAVVLVTPPGGLPPGHVTSLDTHLAALGRSVEPGAPRHRLFVLPPCGAAPPPPAAGVGGSALPSHPGTAPTPPDPALAAWLEAARPELGALVDDLLARHASRVERLQGMAARARRTLWFPFTQHADLPPPPLPPSAAAAAAAAAADAAITTIDARAGEHLVTLEGGGGAEEEEGRAPPPPSLTLLHDSCAAWWTQGVASPSRPAALLPRAVGAAIGRYGHVIHPKAAAEPVLAAAESLLAGPGAGWAGRVFFSDDGSTAVEVALKMAFRASAHRRQAAAEAAGVGADAVAATVLGVAGGYHGDTLGAMCATRPSLFNGPAQTPWYDGRGLFLDPPTAGLEGGGAGWVVRGPGGGAATPVPGGLAGLFSPGRLAGPPADAYQAAIAAALDAHEAPAGSRGGGGGGGGGAPPHPPPVLSALLFEPVLMGAGGMALVDPAWHVALVRAARARSIPVIADEVFSGLWRLGAVSGCDLLGVRPDIGCYAKLLTGGALPLAATLASDGVFDAFSAGGIGGALLHGHSYSAHPAGCAAAAASAAAVVGAANPALCSPRAGAAGAAPTCPRGCDAREVGHCGRLVPLWDGGLLQALADHPAVARVAAIGTVLAVHLGTPGGEGGGYGSAAAATVAGRLRAHREGGGGDGGGVYARPLGDVLYLMLTPTSVPGADGPRLQRALLACL